jgi:hypothetical protein
LRGDPDDGGEIQAAHQFASNLRGDPDDGGEIQKAAQASVPSLRGDPDDGGQSTVPRTRLRAITMSRRQPGSITLR